jgi:hypothetical protein
MIDLIDLIDLIEPSDQGTCAVSQTVDCSPSLRQIARVDPRRRRRGRSARRVRRRVAGRCQVRAAASGTLDGPAEPTGKDHREPALAAAPAAAISAGSIGTWS